jgi:hypothetical protein
MTLLGPIKSARNGHSRRRRPASPSIIKRLHSREHDASVFLYGFDLLAIDGADIRRERLEQTAIARAVEEYKPNRCRSRTRRSQVAESSIANFDHGGRNRTGRRAASN